MLLIFSVWLQACGQAEIVLDCRRGCQRIQEGERRNLGGYRRSPALCWPSCWAVLESALGPLTEPQFQDMFRDVTIHKVSARQFSENLEREVEKVVSNHDIFMDSFVRGDRVLVLSSLTVQELADE
jgi:hypothetical protein